VLRSLLTRQYSPPATAAAEPRYVTLAQPFSRSAPPFSWFFTRPRQEVAEGERREVGKAMETGGLALSRLRASHSTLFSSPLPSSPAFDRRSHLPAPSSLKDFMEVVAKAWIAVFVGSSVMGTLLRRMRHTALALRGWGAGKKLSGREAKLKILQQIDGLDTLEEACLLDEEDRVARADFKAKYDGVLCKEEIYWKQRFRDS
ncbi:hypothetical protein Taro_028620, partial [Colocasia esculenta]|nr:hypothetical protein [Colocasia esculenta]